MSEDDIRRIVMRGNTGEYSHVIIWCDTFDYEDAARFVKYDEDINELVSYYNDFSKMRKIMEVYNYNLDLEMQLRENQAYHIEPFGQTKIIDNNSMLDNISYSTLEKNSLDDVCNSLKSKFEISEKLKAAIKYASLIHKDQIRLNGDAYIIHPLHVVENVLKYKKSKNIETLLISACLHDTLEDTEATYYDIVSKFGPLVASIVLELTTDEDMKLILGKQQYLSIKMKNMSSWALVIKLCDRLDNVNDLVNCNDEEFKDKYLNEMIGIIKYLLNNAKLSNTHITIIEQILRLLIQLSKNDNEKFDRLTEIINQHSKIKIDIEEYSLFSKLLEVVIKVDKGKQYIKKKSNYF